MTLSRKGRGLTTASLIAAMYAAVTLAIAPFSFGPVQFRLAEAMTVLPVFTKAAIPGLTVGCFLANLVGLLMGANPAGAWDVLLGPIATLLGAVATYTLRGITVKGVPVLSGLPVVGANAAIIGGELALLYFGGGWPAFWICSGQVAVGELVAAVGLGGVLWSLLQKSGAAERLFLE